MKGVESFPSPGENDGNWSKETVSGADSGRSGLLDKWQSMGDVGTVRVFFQFPTERSHMITFRTGVGDRKRVNEHWVIFVLPRFARKLPVIFEGDAQG